MSERAETKTIPQLPVLPENFSKINRHLVNLNKKNSSTYWEFRRNEQMTIPNEESGLVEIWGLYQSSSVRPPCLKLRRSARLPLLIYLVPRHRLHKIYRNSYFGQIPQSLKNYFSEYDLAKAWYVVNILDRFQINPTNVLEIGGGIGLVGLAMGSRFTNINYTNIDLNEMLPSATMLALAIEPSQKLELITNGFKVGNSKFVNDLVFANPLFDLGINMTSFQEMDAEQIGEYMVYLSSAIIAGGYFISINRDKKVNKELKLNFSHKDVPWPTNFNEIYSEESLISKYSGKKVTISTKVFKVS